MESTITYKRPDPRIIYKYPLRTDHKLTAEIELPVESYFCHVGIDHQGDVCLWYSVSTNPHYSKEIRTFRVYVTGEIIPSDNRNCFMGTVITKDYLVWHVFEIFN